MILDLMKEKKPDKLLLNYRFRTNAKKITFIYKAKQTIFGEFPHVGVICKEGISILYKHPIKNQWLNVEAFSRVSPVSVDMSHIIRDGSTYEVMVYPPFLGELESLSVKVPDDYILEPVEENSSRNILVAGGEKSFGIGCTVPNLCFPNILGRRFDANVYNLSSLEENYLDELHDYLEEDEIPEFDYGIMEIDLNQKKITYKDDIRKILNQMLTKCTKVICWFCLAPEDEDNKFLIYEIFDGNLLDKKNIILKNLSHMFDKEYRERCTFSNTTVNDTGNIMIFKELSKEMGDVLKWNI